MSFKVYHNSPLVFQAQLNFPVDIPSRCLPSCLVSTCIPCAAIGLESAIVEMEIDYSNCPPVVIGWLPDVTVQESRERVQTAVKITGLHFPHQRIVVNLSPVSICKVSPAYDLPISVGMFIVG